MIPDPDFLENGLLIITGSNLHAEQADRPLAYKLKQTIEDMYQDNELEIQVVVMSDIWYLNGEALHRLPMISIGCTGDNAVSACLFKDMASALVVDDVLMIQMELTLHMIIMNSCQPVMRMQIHVRQFLVTGKRQLKILVILTLVELIVMN